MLARLAPTAWSCLGLRTASQGLSSTSRLQQEGGMSAFMQHLSTSVWCLDISSLTEGTAAVSGEAAGAAGATFAGAQTAQTVDRAKERADLEAHGRRKLYFGNLPWSYSTDSLMQLLKGRFGETVHDAIVMRDKRTNLSKGFGFATLDVETAQKAIAELNNIDVEGRSIKVAEVKDSREYKPEDKPRKRNDNYRYYGNRRGGQQRPPPERAGGEYGV